MQSTEPASLRSKRNSLLAAWEKRRVEPFARFFMRFSTNHLTLMTIIWSLMAFGCGIMLAITQNPWWLMGVNLSIILQYITDFFDGYVGRAKGSGLVKWGYFMDHLLDYVFLCAIFFSYIWLLPAEYSYISSILLLSVAALMVQIYFRYHVAQNFDITYYGIGPTEGRIVLIVLNTFIVALGSNWLPILFLLFSAGAFAVALTDFVRTIRSTPRSLYSRSTIPILATVGLFVAVCTYLLASIAADVHVEALSAMRLYAEVSLTSLIVIQLMLSTHFLAQHYNIKRRFTDRKTRTSFVLLVGMLAVIIIHQLFHLLGFSLNIDKNTVFITYLTALFAFMTVYGVNIISIQHILLKFDMKNLRKSQMISET